MVITNNASIHSQHSTHVVVKAASANFQQISKWCKAERKIG